MTLTTLTLCQECQKPGSIVSLKTITSLLKLEIQSTINRDLDYFFCSTQDCNIAYFSLESTSHFSKQDLIVPVGLKEIKNNDATATLCYCFNFTAAMIRAEIEYASNTTILGQIKTRMQANACECEIKNPSGHCCLGEIAHFIKSEQKDCHSKNIAIVPSNTCCHYRDLSNQ